MDDKITELSITKEGKLGLKVVLVKVDKKFFGIITDVNPESIFYTKNVERGDILLEYNGKVLNGGHSLKDIYEIPDGENINFKILKQGCFDIEEISTLLIKSVCTLNHPKDQLFAMSGKVRECSSADAAPMYKYKKKVPVDAPIESSSSSFRAGITTPNIILQKAKLTPKFCTLQSDLANQLIWKPKKVDKGIYNERAAPQYVIARPKRKKKSNLNRFMPTDAESIISDEQKQNNQLTELKKRLSKSCDNLADDFDEEDIYDTTDDFDVKHNDEKKSRASKLIRQDSNISAADAILQSLPSTQNPIVPKPRLLKISSSNENMAGPPLPKRNNKR